MSVKKTARVDCAASFSQKRVLVTGGLGFIGSNLVRRLADLGAKISLLDSLFPEGGGNRFNISGIEDRVSVSIDDLHNDACLRGLLGGQDFLFNLAGQTSHMGSMQKPQVDLQVNAGDQLKILELCRQENPTIKIVFASTRQVYGHPRYLPVDEKHPVAPIDYNGVSKLAGEWYHTICQSVYGLRTTSLRLTNVYGPRMRIRDARQSFIGWWFLQALDDRELPVYGDGTQIRDFNYVDDVVEALLLCAADPNADGQTYNLGGDEPIGLLDLARLIVNIAGSGSWKLVPYPAERRPIEIGDYYGDYAKIQTQLGWCPKVPLREGIARTLDFYRQHQGEYR
jgi:UDP-glucose 4-epimerase